MTDCIINNKQRKISGQIDASPSKSQSLRAILFATIAEGTSKIDNIILSPDARSMIKACCELGAEISENGNSLSVRGVASKLQQPDDVIDAGNSGIVLRFVACICGLIDGYCVITGDHSIRHNRPVKPLIEGLQKLGVFVQSMRLDDKAPLIIKGPVTNSNTELDGADSQPVSGLIISSLLSQGDTVIAVNNPGEKPWLDLTLNWLDNLKLDYSREGYTKFVVPGPQNIKSFNYFVPSDLSSISFPLALAVITNSEIIINNVDLSDPQGDKYIIDIFSQMGARIEYDPGCKKLMVKRHSGLSGIIVDINSCIDVINILAVVACFAKGQTKITGAKIARSKECDRISAISTELNKMGADTIEFDDGLFVNSVELQPCNNLNTYRDHRMVMALFVASIAVAQNNTNSTSNESKIMDVSTVAKSYPDFFKHMQTLGCDFSLV